MTAAPSTKFANERWVDVNGWEGLYQVSDLGQVRRIRKDPRVAPYKILKQARSSGYRQVSLSRNGSWGSHYVHRLVAVAFVPGDHSLSVDHIDGDKSNNQATNLQWCTKAENTAMSYPRLHGRSNRT